ncbi:PulJ/GspJ family protein [Salinivibrio socompensis]|uniref:PulJ/GspJ family protein n=1 Tax=Salinivibrio socompensis TaxID=1510206 RepID=UPI000472B5BC|nr:prepilin-type N-terminal cleavage/methylation domain-containing protein [Salinivibrio socompensis]
MFVPNNNKQTRAMHGFTLIEVLIALAILSASLATVLGMFSQGQQNTAKVSQVYQITRQQNNIFNALQQINPAQKQQGTQQLGAVTYQWQAAPISPLAPVRSEDGTGTQYVQLYKITVDYQYKGQSHQFAFEKLGWQEGTG